MKPKPKPKPDRLAALEAQAAAMAADYGPRLIAAAEKIATLEAGQSDLTRRLAEAEAQTRDL